MGRYSRLVNEMLGDEPAQAPPPEVPQIEEKQLAPPVGTKPGRYAHLVGDLLGDTPEPTPDAPVRDLGRIRHLPPTGEEGGLGTGPGEPRAWHNVLSSAVMNLPGSAMKVLTDMIEPIMSPVQTADAMAKMLNGAAQKVIPGEQRHEEYFDAFVNHMKSRYGSIEQVNETISADPAGVLADMATFISGGIGAPLRGIGATKALGEVAGATSRIMRPIEGAQRIATKIIGEGPEKAWAKSAKLSEELTPLQRKTIAGTAIRAGVAPNIRGIQKVSQKLENIDVEIDTNIRRAVEVGSPIPINKLMAEFENLKKDFFLTGTPAKHFKEIDDIKRGLREASKQMRQKALSPAEAQTLIRKIQDDTQAYRLKMEEAPAGIRAQNAIEKAATSALEEIIPELRKLNRQSKEFKDLKAALNTASKGIKIGDLLRIFKGPAIGLAAGGGGMAAGLGIHGVTAAASMGLLQVPALKGPMRKALVALRNKGVTITPTNAGIRLGLYQIGRAKEVITEEEIPIAVQRP